MSDKEELDVQVPVLALQLMGKLHQDATSTMNSLIHSYKRDLDKQKATLAAVRDTIGVLCSKPWTPNPQDILDALYPGQKLVEAFMEETERT